MNATELLTSRQDPVAPALPASGDMPDSLAVLVEDLARRVEAGEPIDAEAFIATHAQHEEALRRLLPAIMALAAFGNSHEAPTVVDPLLGVTDDAGRLGDFRIIREIGRGGMGVVYEAEQISLSRRVALKVLPFAAILDDRQLKRFKLEATAAASLKHPNIVSVYCVGCERGVHFYAMEYVEGQTLAAVIEGMRGERREASHSSRLAPRDEASSANSADTVRRVAGVELGEPPGASAETVRLPAAALSTLAFQSSPLPSRSFFRAVAELGIQAAEALDHAHQIGIVHRDIKPSNLMLECSHLPGAPGRDEATPLPSSEEAGRGVKSSLNPEPRTLNPAKLFITDFGLAHIEGHAGGASLTMTGDLLGTLRYMSPEQAEGHSAVLDHRTDIYSLGITLYELLTLRPAFPAENRQTLLKQIASEEPPAPRKLNKSIPADLETIVLKAIQKNPADRYPSARHLADDLRRFLDQQPIKARRPSTIDRARRWAGRHAAFVAIAFAALILVAASGIAAAILTARAYTAKSKEYTRAEANLRLAAQSIESLVFRISKDPMIAGDVHLAETYLTEATSFLERLLAQSDDADLKRTAAKTYGLVGFACELGGHTDKAEFAYRDEIRLRTELSGDGRDDPAELSGLGRALASLGQALFMTDHFVESEDSYRQAIDIFERLAAQTPMDVEYQLRLADALVDLAQVLEARDQFQEADKIARRCTAIAELLPLELVERGSKGRLFSFRGALAGAQARVACREGRFDDALRLLDVAIDEHQLAALKLYNNATGVKRRMDEHFCDRANVLLRAGRLTEVPSAVDDMLRWTPASLKLCHKGIELMLRCAEITSSDQTASSSTAETYRDKAKELFQRAKTARHRDTVDADHFAWFLLTCRDESFRNPVGALELAQTVVRRVPERDSAYRTLALAQYRLGKLDAAEAALSHVVRQKSNPLDNLVQALVSSALGEQDEARTAYRRANAEVRAGAIAGYDVLLREVEQTLHTNSQVQ